MKIIAITSFIVSLISFLFIDSPTSNTDISVFELTSDELNWVNETKENLTLFEKCAQLVVPYAYAYDTAKSSTEYKRLINLVKKYKVGGILFLGGELEKQIELTNEIQKISKVPLIISADYERGPGMRLKEIAEFPYNMALGAADDPHLTYLVGKATAEISRKIGVHQNYAPLVDVNDYINPIINIRSFTENPFSTAVHATSFIKGMTDGGMISTAKHFPGHGSTDIDSHNALPLIDQTVEEFEEKDLIPFRESIDAGVKSVMIGHLLVPAYEEEELPATFSKNIVNNLLKDELGFKGLVITDALNMNAISDNYDAGEAAVNAINAGNDIILFPADDSAAVWGIYNAVKENRISEKRIDQSLNKILAAKTWLGLNANKPINKDHAVKYSTNLRFQRLARTVAEKSITLVKDDLNLLPLNIKKYNRISSIALTDLTDRNSIKEELYFHSILRENIPAAKTFKLHFKSRKRDFKKSFNIAKKSDLIILPIYSNIKSLQGEERIKKEYKKLINDILKLNKPVIAISFGDPYLLSDINNVSTYLCAYGSVDVSEEAIVEAILGKISIQGKLPVTIPNTNFTIGSGINKNAFNLFNDIKDSLYDFASVDSLMEAAINDSIFPGAVLLVGKGSRIIHHKAYGNYTYNKNSQQVTTTSLFDLASVSKVVGTTSAAMLLYDRGLLNLDKKVIEYLPEFNNKGKDKITVRNLLLHNSGLPPFVPFYKYFSTREEVIDSIMNIPLSYETGTKYVYSDLGMITLQQIIERITGLTQDQFLKSNLFEPLEMNNTMYNPPKEFISRCVPTEVDNYWRMDTLQGRVHDETAFLLGGVAGHAGLFSTAEDISHLIFTLLNNGEYKGKKIFNPKTIDEWTSKQTPQSTRGLGWDTKSPTKSSAGHYFSMNSFGHTGFTGTSVWADKDNDLFVVLLTNRVHPSRKNRKIIKFRPVLHDAVFKVISFE